MHYLRYLTKHSSLVIAVASLYGCMHTCKQLFIRMGIPRVITTDQGSEFNNKLNQKLMSELQIDHRLTTAYHPQVHS